MKKFLPRLLVVIFSTSILVFGQSDPVKPDAKPDVTTDVKNDVKTNAKPDVKADSKPDERTAQAIFEEANGYLGKRYQEFNKQNLAYDPKVEAQVKKDVEQSLRFAEESPLPDESELYTDVYANPI